MKRILLLSAALLTLFGCTKTPADNPGPDNPVDPPGPVIPDPSTPSFTVTTLFGTAGFSNPVSGKKDGGESEAVLGAVRGMGWIEAGKTAFILEQSQTIRLWDLEKKRLSMPYTYGTDQNVPWLGILHGGKVWFADKAKAEIRTYDPASRVNQTEAARSEWAGKSVIDIAFNEGGDAFVAVRDLNAVYKFTGGDFTAAPALTIDLGAWPLSLVFDADGNLIVSTNGCQIVKVDPMTGATEVIAGVKDAKTFDDGIPGSPLTAKFTANIADVAIAPNGDLYVADSHRIRRIRKGSGGYADALVETVAGSIQQKNRAQIANGVGTAASFNLIGGLLMSEDGKRLYISDQAAGMIRELWIGDGVIPVSTEKKLRAGTYNIRFYNDADEGNRHWDVRKAAVLQLLKDYAFDVIGFQESRPEQRTFLKENLPGYTFKETDEEPCLAWKTEKFTRLDEGVFYLSPTPDVASSPAPGWVETDPGRKRLCVWVKLHDKDADKDFYFLTTHLEVASSGTSITEDEALTIRVKSAELIIEKVRGMISDGSPVILTGDMNSTTTESTHADYFKTYFTDTYYRSAELGVNPNPIATYNAWSDTDEQAKKWYHRYDYQYYKGDLDVSRYLVLRINYDGVLPSDHWPVLVDYIYK